LRHSILRFDLLFNFRGALVFAERVVVHFGLQLFLFSPYSFVTLSFFGFLFVFDLLLPQIQILSLVLLFGVAVVEVQNAATWDFVVIVFRVFLLLRHPHLILSNFNWLILSNFKVLILHLHFFISFPFGI